MIKKLITVLVLTLFVFSSSLTVYAQQDRIRDDERRQVDRIGADVSDRSDRVERFRDMAKDRKAKHKQDTDKFKRHCTDKPSDSVECVGARRDVAKGFDNIIERLLTLNRRMHDRVQESDLAGKGDLLDVTDRYYEDLLALREDLAGDHAATPAALRDARRDLHNLWKEYKKDLANTQARLWEKRATGILQRAESISIALERVLESQLKRDRALNQEAVARIEHTLDAIDNKVAAVKQSLRADLRPEARPGVKQSLQELHVLLQEAVKGFRDLNRGNVATTAISDAVSDVV